MGNKKRILLCEYYQETNTFNPVPYTLDMFRDFRYAEGEDFYEKAKKVPDAAHGMIETIEEMDGVVVPGISLLGWAGGAVDDEVYELLLERTKYYIQNSGQIDAVFVSCHGALSNVSEEDGTGAYLEYIREMVGADIPIAISCDLHANITQRILDNADIICGYNCYPHTDIYQTGVRAARLGMRMLNGDKIYTAVTTLPMLVPPSGYSTVEQPFKEMKDYGDSLVKQGTLLDYSNFIVQAWMDLKEIHCCVLTIADEESVALKYADEMAEHIFDMRDEMMPELNSIDEVFALAEDPQHAKPVILVNPADSTNSGSIGDGAEAAVCLKKRGSALKMSCVVKDDEVVDQAFKVGVGNTADFCIGGKYTVGMEDKFCGKGRVVSLHNGAFRAEGPENRNVQFNLGPTAVLNFDNIDIIVCKNPSGNGDPQLFRHFGIEPTMYDLIEVKANASFRVPYGKFTNEFYYVDLYGASSANLKRFKWKNLPGNLYPFDLSDNYRPEPAKIKGKL